MTSERRKSMRVATEHPISCAVLQLNGTLGPPFEATLLDIGVGGLSFLTVEDVPAGAIVRVRLKLAEPPIDETLIVRGLHSQRGPRGQVFGGAFEALEQASRTAITRFVFAEAKRTGTAPPKAAEASKDRFAPGSLEMAIRPDAVPPGQGPTTWVDAVLATTIQLVLDGDEWTRKKYPQATEMLDHYVKQRALEHLRDQKKAS